MLARSKDAAFLNRVLSDPSVYEAVALGTGKRFDLSTALEDERNIFLANEFGGFVFIHCGNGLYDVHTQFLPEGRGAKALAAAREAAQYLFVSTDCLALRTFIVRENRAAVRLAKWMGFVPIDVATVCDCEGIVYLLTIKRWVEMTCQ